MNKHLAVAVVETEAAALPLTLAEEQQLWREEDKIRNGLQTFREVGEALTRIRDGRLYRAQFGTFEEYCADRWGMTGRRARQLSDAAGVVRELLLTMSEARANGDSQELVPPALVPATESQARPLTGLEPAKARQAWDEAVQASGGQQPTAKAVQEAAESFRPATSPEEESPCEVVVVSREFFVQHVKGAYSADLLSEKKVRIRKPFYLEAKGEWGDCTVMAMSGIGDGGGSAKDWYAEAYQLIPVDLYRGPARRKFSYHGETVMWRHEWFKLGPMFKVVVAARESDEAEGVDFQEEDKRLVILEALEKVFTRLSELQVAIDAPQSVAAALVRRATEHLEQIRDHPGLVEKEVRSRPAIEPISRELVEAVNHAKTPRREGGKPKMTAAKKALAEAMKKRWAKAKTVVNAELVICRERLPGEYTFRTPNGGWTKNPDVAAVYASTEQARLRWERDEVVTRKRARAMCRRAK